MVCLGLEDFTFAGVADDTKVQDGKQSARIGISYPMSNLVFLERTERERELKSAIAAGGYGQQATTGLMAWITGSAQEPAGFVYSSKYFIENP